VYYVVSTLINVLFHDYPDVTDKGEVRELLRRTFNHVDAGSGLFQPAQMFATLKRKVLASFKSNTEH